MTEKPKVYLIEVGGKKKPFTSIDAAASWIGNMWATQGNKEKPATITIYPSGSVITFESPLAQLERLLRAGE